MAKKKAGHTKSVMLNEKPALMIQAVRVVPILAPMMTDMACAKVRRPALTNDTVITVVAVEDCLSRCWWSWSLIHGAAVGQPSSVNCRSSTSYQTSIRRVLR